MAVENTGLARDTDEEELPQTVIESPINIRSVSLTLLGVVAAVFTLQQGRDFFIPLVLSGLVSYALDPPVNWLVRIRIPRAVAAGIVLLLVVGAVGAGLYSLRD